MLPQLPPAVLALADGTVFRGCSIGAATQAAGEVVFNTAITGYQEILTDPSYSRQIVTLTYPHIGNYGVNPEDVESNRIHAAGLVIRDLPIRASNFRATETLSDYLRREGVPGIAGIDTRRLTRILRERGAQAGCLVAATEAGEAIDEEAAVAAARAFPGSGRHGPGEGGQHHRELRMGPDRLAARRGLRRADRAASSRRRVRLRREAQHPSPAGRTRLRDHGAAGAGQRSRRAGAVARRRSSCPTAPATRSPATTRSPRPGN